jgi:hypothetical protein
MLVHACVQAARLDPDNESKFAAAVVAVLAALEEADLGRAQKGDDVRDTIAAWATWMHGAYSSNFAGTAGPRLRADVSRFFSACLRTGLLPYTATPIVETLLATTDAVAEADACKVVQCLVDAATSSEEEVAHAHWGLCMNLVKAFPSSVVLRHHVALFVQAAGSTLARDSRRLLDSAWDACWGTFALAQPLLVAVDPDAGSIRRLLALNSGRPQEGRGDPLHDAYLWTVVMWLGNNSLGPEDMPLALLTAASACAAHEPKLRIAAFMVLAKAGHCCAASGLACIDVVYDVDVALEHRLAFVNTVLRCVNKFAADWAATFLDMGVHVHLGNATRALAFEATLQPRIKHAVKAMLETMHSAYAQALGDLLQ